VLFSQVLPEQILSAKTTTTTAPSAFSIGAGNASRVISLAFGSRSTYHY
jgi:hypothetical protein